MSSFELNADTVIETPEQQRVQDATTQLAETSSQALQALAQAAGGFAGAMAGAITAPLTVAAAAGSHAAEDDVDEGHEDIQQQQQEAGFDGAPQPTTGSEVGAQA